MPTPFHEYAKAYPKLLASADACLRGSLLPKLEEIALRFAHALEGRALDLKEGNERVFLSEVLVKTTNEMFATIGSLRNGALLPSYHHTRSVLELAAALDYVYRNPAKRERRLEKFVEYVKVSRYSHFKKWKQRLSAGEVTEDEFTKHCPVPESEFQDLGKRVPEWRRIWKFEGNDPRVIQNWHYEAKIKDLFQSSEILKECWFAYEMISHATHLSPFGKNIRGGNLVIGFPSDSSVSDYQKINFPIYYGIRGAQVIAIRLHDTVKAGLIEGILDLN